MATPLMRDDRGYEMQFATNHLGHFQLTARLWEALKKSRNARVVALSSCGHSMGEVDFSDPNFNKRLYDKWVAYGQSKSANSLLQLSLISEVKSMVFVHLRPIQAESSPISFAT